MPVFFLSLLPRPDNSTIRKHLALNISLGTLLFAADASFLDGIFKNAKLADNKNQQIVITCGLGGQALLAGKLLKDYGFTNVKVLLCCLCLVHSQIFEPPIHHQTTKMTAK